MLLALQVHNFALIEDATIEFTPGFNVFTGETGAGKSILIDAFGVALGSRASVEFVRAGTQECWVQAVFDIAEQPEIIAQLNELGLSSEEETLFFKRRISKEGKSQAYVNGALVPLQQLKSLSQQVVDIHGQHENQQLLRPQAPLELLDLYGQEQVAPAWQAYHQAYTEYLELGAQVEALESQAETRADEIDRLQYSLQEIQDCQPTVGEEDSLRESIKKGSHSEKILQSASTAHQLLANEEAVSTGILDALDLAQSELGKAGQYDEKLANYAQELKSAWITIDDIRQELGVYLSQDSFDAAALEKQEARLNTLTQLKKKYGGSLEAVLAYATAAQEQLEQLTNYEETLAKARQARVLKEEELSKLATHLTQLRQAAATSLSALLSKEIKDLAMEQGVLQLRVEPLAEYNAKGRDKVQMLFSANLGVEPKPVDKIASGGELSRIALAIKTVLVNSTGAPTMVFDEIDTGVGGITAQRMAEKMARIALAHQVLCVTHLPQIAVFGDTQFQIKKLMQEQKTQTVILQLDAQERQQEIVRMMNGENNSEAAQSTATELLDLAQKKKEGWSQVS